MELGKRILELRKKSGLSQEQLGDKVNVTRQTISNWELGATAPNPEQLKLLSKAFNISIDELLDNSLQNVVLSKIKITENQTKTIKKILKTILIGFIALLIIDIIVFIICFTKKIGPFEKTKTDNEISYVMNEGYVLLNEKYN